MLLGMGVGGLRAVGDIEDAAVTGVVVEKRDWGSAHAKVLLFLSNSAGSSEA